MRFLITGAAGFIGSHIADRLVADGHFVVGVDNLLTGRRQNFPDWVEWKHAAVFFEADITERHRFYELANYTDPDVIIHCAASYSDPNLWHRDVDTNITGTINSLLAAKHHGAKLAFFQTALPARSSYAISKLAGAQYFNLASNDVNWLTFRLANIYGPRNVSGPIPTFYRRLANGETCTVVDTARDMVYVDDLVNLVVQAIGTDLTGTFDVCSGTDTPIIELYREVAATFSDRPEFGDPDVFPRPSDDVPNMDLSPLRAFSYFNWRPTTPLRTGIRAAVDWYRANGVGQTFTHLKLGKVA